jgi:signal transduction histidine kinase
LAEILTMVVDASRMRTNSSVQLEINALPEIKSTMLNNTAYRFVQEGLNNSFRHAEALEHKVSARVDGGNLILEVSDNGRGFNTAPTNRTPQHLGISAMRNRIMALGGQFKINSRQGKGTTLRALIPLDQLESHNAKELDEVSA